MIAIEFRYVFATPTSLKSLSSLSTWDRQILIELRQLVEQLICVTGYVICPVMGDFAGDLVDVLETYNIL